MPPPNDPAWKTAAAKKPFNHVEWVIAEVLQHRQDGQTIGKHISDFLRDFTAKSQSLHEMVRAKCSESIKTVSGGDEITRADIEKAIYDWFWRMVTNMPLLG